jgi:hypothetical protein
VLGLVLFADLHFPHLHKRRSIMARSAASVKSAIFSLDSPFQLTGLTTDTLSFNIRDTVFIDAPSLTPLAALKKSYLQGGQ